MTDLIIRGSSADLEELRRRIEVEVGREARLQPVTEAQAGQLREPMLIALIVGLGSGQLTIGVTDVIKRYLAHREKMQELADSRHASDQDREIRLALVTDDTERPTTLEELARTADGQ